MSSRAEGSASPSHEQDSIRRWAGVRRQRYSISGIKRGLLLSDTTYTRVHDLIEQYLIEQNQIGRIPRSAQEKRATQEGVTKAFTEDASNVAEFPSAVQAMRCHDGQIALGAFISKICSNYRRRHKKPRRTGQVLNDTTQGNVGPTYPTRSLSSTLPTTSTTDVNSGELAIGFASRLFEEACFSEISVVNRQGIKKEFGLLSELSAGCQDGILTWRSLISDISFEKFLTDLTSDGMLRRDRECVCSKDELENRVLIVQNERHWRASITRMVRTRRPIIFYVLSRDDAEAAELDSDRSGSPPSRGTD